jgi:hypothetical protein
MPARPWAEFSEVYYRPHLLVVKLGTSTGSATGRKLVDLLRRLIESLRSSSDYAILPDGHVVKIAFESDLDAEVARGFLRALIAERGGDEWASKSICDFASSTWSTAR